LAQSSFAFFSIESVPKVSVGVGQLRVRIKGVNSMGEIRS